MKTKLALGAMFVLSIFTSAYAAEVAPSTPQDVGNRFLLLAAADMPMHDGMSMQPQSDSQKTAKEYRARGKVVAVQNSHGITLAHEPIPALKWPAMTMEFGVAAPDVVKGIAPGDNVAFRFVQRGNKYVVTQLEKTGR